MAGLAAWLCCRADMPSDATMGEPAACSLPARWRDSGGRAGGRLKKHMEPGQRGPDWRETAGGPREPRPRAAGEAVDGRWTVAMLGRPGGSDLTDWGARLLHGGSGLGH